MSAKEKRASPTPLLAGFATLKLDTIGRVITAQGKLFRAAAAGKISPAEMARMMFGLASIRDSIKAQFEFEEYREQFARLNALEHEIAERNGRGQSLDQHIRH